MKLEQDACMVPPMSAAREPWQGAVGLGAFIGLVAVIASLTSSTGCDDGSGGSGGVDPCADEIRPDQCFKQDCVDLPSTAVSFKNDVLPIFEQSCSLSASCHGNQSS